MFLRHSGGGQLSLNHLVPGCTTSPAAFRDDGAMRFGTRAPSQPKPTPYPSMERADDGDGVAAGRVHLRARAPGDHIDRLPVCKSMEWLDYYTHDGDARGRARLIFGEQSLQPTSPVVRLALWTTLTPRAD